VYAGSRVVELVDWTAPEGENRADDRLLRHPCAIPVQRRAVRLPVRRACGRIRREATGTDRVVDGRRRLSSLPAVFRAAATAVSLTPRVSETIRGG